MLASTSTSTLLYGKDAVSVDFDSMASGSATEGVLNSNTTGGTWATNTYTGGGQTLVHTIEDDNGGSEKALFSNFPANSDNPSEMWTARINLDTAIDIDKTGFGIDFEVGTRMGTGFSKPVTWRLIEGTTELLKITVNNGTLSVNGNNEGSIGSGSDTSAVGSSWDSTDDYVWNIDIDVDNSGNVDLVFHGTTATQNVSTSMVSTANFDRFECLMDPDNWKGQGIYLSNFVVTTPDPNGSVFRFH